MEQWKKRKSDRVQHLGDSADKTIKLVDLSATGASFCQNRPIPRGTIIKLQVSSIKVKAKIVHCTEQGHAFRLGVQFIEVPDSLQEQLNELVERYSKGVPVECKVVEGN